MKGIYSRKYHTQMSIGFRFVLIFFEDTVSFVGRQAAAVTRITRQVIG